jgi:hypothetical protein
MQRRRGSSPIRSMVFTYLLIGACALAGLTACSSGSDGYTSATTVPYKSIRAKNERMLLVPDIEVGNAGWCVLVPKGEVGCETERLIAPILKQDWSSGGPPQVTEGSALTTSEVTAVSVNGGPRIPTRSMRGLPDGLRAVAVELPGYELKRGGRRGTRLRFTPLDAHGQRIRRRLTRLRLTAFEIPTERVVEPSRPGNGACRVEQAPALAGVVATQAVSLMRVAPVGELLAGALLPCANTTFRMEGVPIVATLLLDAAHPGREPARLPAVQQVAGHPGVVRGPVVEQGTEEGEIVARRVRGAWLAVSKGKDLQQRLALLEHLHAVVHLY